MKISGILLYIYIYIQKQALVSIQAINEVTSITKKRTVNGILELKDREI